MPMSVGHSIDKASKGIWKWYIGSIPILGVRVVQVHISDAAGSFPDMQALSVFPAEISKMLALVCLQKASKRCNDVP